MSVFVCEQLNEELKQNLRETMINKYQKENYQHITRAVDKLQQEVSLSADGGISHCPLGGQVKLM